MLHANGSPAGGRDPFYARRAGKLPLHECGMWSAECGMSVESSQRGSIFHFNSAFRNPHSALV